MQKFGMAIHLTNYRGPINITGNTFSRALLNYKDMCLYYEDGTGEMPNKTFEMMPKMDWLSIDKFYNTDMDKETSLLIPHQHDALQLHSLIVLDNVKSDQNIAFNNNIIKDNIVTNALLSIS
jgi:hypothetical protein